jgi:hypothetical protein
MPIPSGGARRPRSRALPTRRAAPRRSGSQVESASAGGLVRAGEQRSPGRDRDLCPAGVAANHVRDVLPDPGASKTIAENDGDAAGVAAGRGEAERPPSATPA